jgi:hypothetical protein
MDEEAMIKLTVEIPDTDLARSALSDYVHKLVTAHQRAVKTQADIAERKEKERQEYLDKRYGKPKQEEAEEKVVIPDCLNDLLTIGDLKAVVDMEQKRREASKEQLIKLKKGRKSADQYKEILAELPNIDDLVSGYKLEQAGGFS